MEPTEEMLRLVTEYLRNTGDFVVAQAPLLAQEIYWNAIAQSVLGIVVAIGLALFVKPCIRYAAADKDWDQFHSVFVGAAGVIAGAAAAIVALESASTLLKALVAPRLLIAAKIAAMVN